MYFRPDLVTWEGSLGRQKSQPDRFQKRELFCASSKKKVTCFETSETESTETFLTFCRRNPCWPAARESDGINVWSSKYSRQNERKSGPCARHSAKSYFGKVYVNLCLIFSFSPREKRICFRPRKRLLVAKKHCKTMAKTSARKPRNVRGS